MDRKNSLLTIEMFNKNKGFNIIIHYNNKVRDVTL